MDNFVDERNRWNLWERISSVTGIIFAFLLIYGWVIEIKAGFPPSGDSASEVAQYFLKNKTNFITLVWTALATTPFQIWFFASLFIYFRRIRHDSIWSIIGIISVAVGNAATLFTNFVWGVLALCIDSIISNSPLLQILWVMYHLSGFTLGLISATILIGFGLEMIRIKSTWRCIGYLGIITGVYSAIVWVILCFSEGKASPLSGLSYMLLIIWLLLTSIRLTFGSMIKEENIKNNK
jgi:hypothetical protein